MRVGTAVPSESHLQFLMTASISRRAPSAFTLFELLLVIIVLSVLLIVSAPALFNSTQSSQLTSAGDLVLNKLSEAQQESIASNAEVEVRFFEHRDPDGVDQTPRLRSLQLLSLAAGNGGEVGAPGFLPRAPRTRFAEGIVISGKEKLTSLLGGGFNGKADTEGGEDGRYLSVRFRPDGSTSLMPGKTWFLTLVTEDSERTTVEASNFYTIQIDPATGRMRSFRP
jgi:uncharacterized protein (TIGR02596 family)